MTALDTGTEELLCNIKNRVATITLNKPHKKNALGDILTPALRQTLLVVEARDDVGCVMITGTGDAFCSGGDVSGMSSATRSPRNREEKVAELTEKQVTLTGRLYHLNKPTVAALPGAAAGAGLSLALACDLRVASESAFVTTAFANIGLSGDYGSSWFLPRIVGLAKAKELFYTAERLGADLALELGLLNKVYPDASFRDDAFEFARTIANGPTQTLRLMKKNLNLSFELGLPAALAQEAEHLVQCGEGDEAREAIQAFLDKRKPRFH